VGGLTSRTAIIDLNVDPPLFVLGTSLVQSYSRRDDRHHFDGVRTHAIENAVPSIDQLA